jgi:transcriptional regulator with XRE-family HTH domain
VTVVVLEDDGFARILGDELRRHRRRHGWTRQQFLDQLDLDLSLQTIATYELGTRHMAVRRLYDMCSALSVRVVDVLAAVEARLDNAASGPVVVQLRELAASERPELAPARQWAQTQLNPGGREIARLTIDAIENLSTLCGLEMVEMIRALPKAASASHGRKER